MIKVTDWKTRLLALREAYFKIKLPELAADHGIPKPKPFKDTTANGLTYCIKAWITYSGGDAQRVNTMGVQRRVKGVMKWTRGGSRKGSADIHAILWGRALSIEVKIGNDDLSDDQQKEKQRIESAGGIYFVARNMESFVSFFDELSKHHNSHAVAEGH